MKTSLIKNPRPGDFAAVCRQPSWLAQHELPAGTDLDSLQNRWDRKRSCNVFLVPCALETKDRAELEAHMRDIHSGGIYRWDNSALGPNVTEVRSYKSRGVDIEKGWSTPKAPAEAKPFAPKSLEPGAEVTWPAGGVMERSGQVWCAGPGPKSAWVIPDEPRMEHHPVQELVRFERALVIKEDHRGELYSTAEVFWSDWAVLEDVA